MVPNKTIYVREADTELWERAEELAGGSVSGLIADALRRYVEEEEQKEQMDMETIEVELAGRRGFGWEETSYDAQFVGQWLLNPDPDETRTGEPGYDAGAYYGVALTQRGKIAVYVRHCNDGFAPELHTYSSFEEAERDGEPADILAMASGAMGAGYVRKLDI
jgi:hypothetical protein